MNNYKYVEMERIIIKSTQNLFYEIKQENAYDCTILHNDKVKIMIWSWKRVSYKKVTL